MIPDLFMVKKNFRILYPTTIIVSPRAANTSVGSSASPGTMDTIFTISGIFFLYNFLVRDPGNQGKRVYSTWRMAG